jgi:hypothetical protein
MLILCLIAYGDTNSEEMRKLVTYSLVIFLLYSCGITEHTRKAIDVAFSSTVTTQKAMTKFLVESTTSIYQNDSIETGMPIYIHLLKASFVSKLDSFELEIDSIKATWNNDTEMTFNKVAIVGDSVIYDEVVIPYYNSYLGKDTLKVRIICEYLPNMNIETEIVNFKCLTANYIIKEQIIGIKDEFKRCYASTSK